jgi:hypothetical protein
MSDPWQSGYEVQEPPHWSSPSIAMHAGPSRWNPNRWSTRIKVISLGGVVSLILAVVLATLLWPSNMTVHGTMDDCTNAINGSEQVVVTNPSGTVIGSGSLTPTGKGSAVTILGQSYTEELWRFTVAVPSGEPRYGITVDSSHGTVWYTPAQMAHGPALSLGC